MRTVSDKRDSAKCGVSVFFPPTVYGSCKRPCFLDGAFIPEHPPGTRKITAGTMVKEWYKPFID
jgi:hypothetical protein